MNPFVYFLNLIAVCIPVWFTLETLVAIYAEDDELEELEFVIIGTVLLIGQHLAKTL